MKRYLLIASAASMLLAAQAFAQTTPAAKPAATAPNPPAAAAATAAATAAPASGDHAGMVWVNDNSKSKAYHCPGDKYYGKTKKGEYMSEADAQAKGFHATHGKGCSADSAK